MPQLATSTPLCSYLPMPRYKLIIFDFDGTLADSAAWMIRKFNEIAQQFAMRAVTEAEIDMLRGRSNREIVQYLGVPMWKVPRIAAEMRRRVAAEAEQIYVFDGLTQMLDALRAAGIRIAIVSSNSESNIRRILRENTAFVDDFECGASLFGKARKLRLVVERSGLESGDALCIGDETRDIEAAREAGIASGAVSWGYAKREALASFSPTLMFDSMNDIALLAK